MKYEDEHENVEMGLEMGKYTPEKINSMIKDSDFSYNDVSNLTGVPKDWLISSTGKSTRIRNPDQTRLDHIGKFLEAFKKFKLIWKL